MTDLRKGFLVLLGHQCQAYLTLMIAFVICTTRYNFPLLRFLGDPFFALCLFQMITVDIMYNHRQWRKTKTRKEEKTTRKDKSRDIPTTGWHLSINHWQRGSRGRTGIFRDDNSIFTGSQLKVLTQTLVLMFPIKANVSSLSHRWTGNPSRTADLRTMGNYLIVFSIQLVQNTLLSCGTTPLSNSLGAVTHT